MTRICSWCNDTIGEKCIKCGNPAPVVTGTNQDGLELYNCHRCGHTWLQGDDPITNGMCDECVSRAKGDLWPNQCVPSKSA